MRSRMFWKFLSAIWLVAAMTIGAMPAGANGVPVKVVLTYLADYSNWGPTGAAGVARINVGEGDIQVTATGLPYLAEDIYEGWLVNTNTSETFSIGKFNADEDGKVDFHAEFDRVPDLEYNFFAISVEPRNDADPEADPRRSIAGFYPVHQAAEGGPAELPKTGDEAPGGSHPMVLAVFGGLLVCLCLGIVIGRRSSASKG